MPNLKELKLRIGGVKKTRQITAAMKLVAAAKLKRAIDRASAAQPYQEKLSATLARVASRAGESVSHPLLEQRSDVKKILVFVLTSDRGLCGGFNSNLLRKTALWMEEKSDVEITVVHYGRKGRDYFKSKGLPFESTVLDYTKRDFMVSVREVSEQSIMGYSAGDFDQVWIARNKFVNTLVQDPTWEQVVPIDVPEAEDDDSSIDYIYEPQPAELLGELLPLFLRTRLLQAFLETEAGFFASQMTAMEAATKNAGELIDELSLIYNRARQAAITTEITEIVSGAEAL